MVREEEESRKGNEKIVNFEGKLIAERKLREEERNKLKNRKNKYEETLKRECLITVRLKEDVTTKDKGKNQIKTINQIIADEIKPDGSQQVYRKVQGGTG